MCRQILGPDTGAPAPALCCIVSNTLKGAKAFDGNVPRSLLCYFVSLKMQTKDSRSAENTDRLTLKEIPTALCIEGSERLDKKPVESAIQSNLQGQKAAFCYLRE